MTRQEAQRKCYDTYQAVIEVETRERGWSASEAVNAKKAFDAAVLEYQDAFNEPPEYEAATNALGFRFPLATATKD